MIDVSSQAGSFIGASAAFVVGVAVAVVVTMFTTSKPDAELVGLMWSLDPREERGQGAAASRGEAGAWWQSRRTITRRRSCSSSSWSSTSSSRAGGDGQ